MLPVPLRPLARSLLRPLARFLRDERGSIAVESVLMLPVLGWIYMGTFVFFDGFRAQSVNVKAAYTIGDILSRQTGYITPEFMDSMAALQRLLTDPANDTRIRVTAFKSLGDQANSVLDARWSQVRGPGISPHTDTTLMRLRPNIPPLAVGEVAILTETWATYEPPVDGGLDPLVLYELVVTRPRFALNNRFCWNSVNDGGTTSTETC